MIKFEPNLMHLFKEVPLMERFERAANAGFEAVEYSVPYDHDPADLAAALERNELKMVAINTPGGNPETQRGLACQPALQSEFRASLDLAIQYGVTLGGPILHCLAGINPDGEELSRAHDCFIENLQYAARMCRDAGLSLGLEPINSVSRPDYFLTGTLQALEIIGEVDEPNVGLILDFYHMAMMGEPILEMLPLAAPVLRHIQIADVPGKGEPGTGKIDFGAAFDLFGAIGYEGWVGLEYTPVSETEAGLTWMDAYLPSGDSGSRTDFVIHQQCANSQ